MDIKSVEPSLLSEIVDEKLATPYSKARGIIKGLKPLENNSAIMSSEILIHAEEADKEYAEKFKQGFFRAIGYYALVETLTDDASREKAEQEANQDLDKFRNVFIGNDEDHIKKRHELRAALKKGDDTMVDLFVKTGLIPPQEPSEEQLEAKRQKRLEVQRKNSHVDGYLDRVRAYDSTMTWDKARIACHYELDELEEE